MSWVTDSPLQASIENLLGVVLLRIREVTIVDVEEVALKVRTTDGGNRTTPKNYNGKLDVDEVCQNFGDNIQNPPGS